MDCCWDLFGGVEGGKVVGNCLGDVRKEETFGGGFKNLGRGNVEREIVHYDHHIRFFFKPFTNISPN